MIHRCEQPISVLVMMDERVKDMINSQGFEQRIITQVQNTEEEFLRLIEQCDTVWPIAPESDGILQDLCATVEAAGKALLTSPASAVKVAGDKFNTFQLFIKHGIATVPTQLYSDFEWDGHLQWIVKPVDGVGCGDNYILSEPEDFKQMSSRKGTYIIQPHLQGKKTSLSCIFKEGKGWLLCVNSQHFEVIDQQYHLVNIIVNHDITSEIYYSLVAKIAEAMPDLWGYVGIDLIETSEQILVLEINPRLTTSFAGIKAALGINVADNILRLFKADPEIQVVCNQPITIALR
jgi:predicted ATP-grasp superfamily ATP-dependent carboligase